MSRVTIYSLDELLSLFGTSLLFHVQFSLLLPDLHKGLSGGSSGGLVFLSVEEFSRAFVIPTFKGFGIVNKAEVGVFLELSCVFNDLIAAMLQFNLWFLCLIKIQLEHLEVYSSHTIEAWLGEF